MSLPGKSFFVLGLLGLTIGNGFFKPTSRLMFGQQRLDAVAATKTTTIIPSLDVVEIGGGTVLDPLATNRAVKVFAISVARKLFIGMVMTTISLLFMSIAGFLTSVSRYLR